jgi:hypothetical protein
MLVGIPVHGERLKEWLFVFWCRVMKTNKKPRRLGGAKKTF